MINPFSRNELDASMSAVRGKLCRRQSLLHDNKAAELNPKLVVTIRESSIRCFNKNMMKTVRMKDKC